MYIPVAVFGQSVTLAGSLMFGQLSGKKIFANVLSLSHTLSANTDEYLYLRPEVTRARMMSEEGLT